MNYPAIFVGVWLLVLFAILGLLVFGRRVLKIDLTTTNIWSTALFIAIFAVVALIGGTYLSGFFLMLRYGMGDLGLGGFLFACGGGFVISTILTCWFSSSRIKRLANKETRTDSIGALSFFIAIALPAISIGSYFAYYGFEEPVRMKIREMKIEAVTVSHDETVKIATDYGLPQVPGAGYPRFVRTDKSKEYYGATFSANASAYGRDWVPWREWTELIADEVEAGLDKSGYQVERFSGRKKQVPTDKGLEELPDIHVLGKKDGRFVCYRIPYAYTQGCSFPVIVMDFGAEEFYDPDKHYLPQIYYY